MLVGAPDSVAGRAKNGFGPAEWWRSLTEASPFSSALQEAAADNEGLICAALSEAYIEMVAADLAALPAETLARLRLFTRAPIGRIPEALRRFLMPPYSLLLLAPSYGYADQSGGVYSLTLFTEFMRYFLRHRYSEREF